MGIYINEKNLRGQKFHLNLTKQGEEFIVMNNHETNMKY
jgi:hypothetical protein